MISRQGVGASGSTANRRGSICRNASIHDTPARWFRRWWLLGCRVGAWRHLGCLYSRSERGGHAEMGTREGEGVTHMAQCRPSAEPADSEQKNFAVRRLPINQSTDWQKRIENPESVSKKNRKENKGPSRFVLTKNLSPPRCRHPRTATPTVTTTTTAGARPRPIPSL